MAHKRPGPGYAWILGLLLLLVLVVPVAAGTGTWTTTGPFATGLGNQVIYALAISPDGSVVYCGTGSGSVFSYTFGIAAPVAGFTGTPVSGSYPLSVQFNDTSTGSPTAWIWDFGDGTTSAEQNATHTYTSTGSFTVSLTASNTAGSDMLSRSGYITVTEPLTANFTGTPKSGTAPLAVTFTDTSTGSPTSWSWDFGDGNTSTNENPSHTYSTAGAFRVNLTVTKGAATNTRSAAGYIMVASASQPLVANFAASPTSGTRPLTVTFTDKSIGSPKLWTWNFGDGTTSTQQNPTHTYTSTGSFSVSLHVVNGTYTDTITQTDCISVSTPATHFAVIAPSKATAGSKIAFTVTALDASGSTVTGYTGTVTFVASDNAASLPADYTFTTSDAGTRTFTATLKTAGLQTINATDSTATSIAGTSGTITVLAIPVTTITTTTTPSDDSGESGRDTSYAATAPGTGAGGTMTFAVNEPLSAGGTGYSYAIISVSIVPAGTLGSTDLMVTDAGATSHAPDGRTVAGIVTISPVAVNPSAISSGTITFAVSENWLSAHGLTPANIVLMRYHDGVWAELPTTFQYEAGGVDYFTATTPGFSYFAITNRAGATTVNASAAVTTLPDTIARTTSVLASSDPRQATYPQTSAPAAQQTTAVPAGAQAPPGSSGFPVTTVALIGAGCVVLAGVGWYIRRWWIQRQNPALFRKYD